VHDSRHGLELQARSLLTMRTANKRGAGKGGITFLWRAGRAWPALPDRERWAAPRFMRVRYAFALCLMVGTGAFAGRAQVSSPSPPFVLAATNISIASVQVILTNVVAFHFADAEAVNVTELDEELAKSGMHSKRLVRIVDGIHLVAEGRLLGRAWGTQSNGFLLKFDSPEAAEKAADAMRDKARMLVFPRRTHNVREGFV
jgi:hypothetical protein